MIIFHRTYGQHTKKGTEYTNKIMTEVTTSRNETLSR